MGHVLALLGLSTEQNQSWSHQPLPLPGSGSWPSAVSLCDLQQVTLLLWTQFLQQRHGDDRRTVTHPRLASNVVVTVFIIPGHLPTQDNKALLPLPHEEQVMLPV